VPPELIVTREVARELAGLSYAIGRQIGLLIDRGGRVAHLIVGSRKEIVIPVLPVSRTSGGRLKGLRCVHTHLDGEGVSEDDLMDLLFLRLDLMAVLKVGEDALPERLYPVHLTPEPFAGKNWRFLEPLAPSRQEPVFLDLIGALEGEFAKLRGPKQVDDAGDRAILVSATERPKEVAADSMDELAELARSAGVEVLDRVIQRRPRKNPRLVLGRGKLAEIMLRALRLNANLLVFDQELNAGQVHSIIRYTELRVIDRTQLILDIFARRALSREGRLQVEMAQLKYMLPRLAARDDALSRLTGGIGARGPGETKLEIDRRRIKERLAALSRKLRAVSRERQHRRTRRRKKALPVISLVGYTNAGKSTLLNALTESDIVAADQLFATLDPTSRRLRFPHDVEVIFTDTVGFIKDLPAELLKAFGATLEELAEADLLVHVIDLSNPRFAEQIEVVERLLVELDLQNIPCLRVANKMDAAPAELAAHVEERYDALAISALDPQTFPALLGRIQSMISKAISRGFPQQGVVWR